MNEIIICVREICGNRIYSRDDARPLYDKIADSLQNHDKAIVDFDDMEIASESFLDEAIVEHYMHSAAEDMTGKLILRRLCKSDQMLLRRIYSYRKQLERKLSRKKHKESQLADGSV